MAACIKQSDNSIDEWIQFEDVEPQNIEDW